METTNPPALPVLTGHRGATSKAGEVAAIERSYSEILRRLWSKKWILLNITIAGAVIGLITGAIQTPLYRLHASLEVQEMNEKFADYATDGSAEPSLRALSDVQTQIRILTSRALVERTINKMPEAERLRLIDVPHWGWKRPTFDQAMESTLKRLDARPSTQARIIDVTFLSQDGPAGATFLNALSQELSDYTLERRWKTSQRTQVWLERELDDFRQKLEQSEREAQEYARASGIAPGSAVASTQAIAPPADARTLPVQRSNAAAALAGDPQLRSIRANLADLNKQLADVEAIYSSQNQIVVKLQEQIGTQQAAYDKRKLAVIAQAREGSATIPAAVAADRPRRIASEDPTRVAHYDTLQREVEANRHLFDTMSARVKQASVDSAMQASNILIVDPAYPSTKSVSPRLWLNSLIGTLCGFAVAIGYVFIQSRISATFAGPANVSRYLGLPLLGTIPIDRYTRQKPVMPPGTERSGPMLHLAFDKGLQTAESYRTIRSSILRSLEQRSHPWRLLFISAGTAESKTNVISNLGAALAGAQRRVLLVDGDLRNPTLHEIFGMENENGLVEFLGKQLPASAADSRQLIRATQIPGLYLLTAGRPGVNAPEILASDHLTQLLRDLVKGFDLVLLDSPPILPYSDARTLARQADGVILVVRANVTERQAAIRARDTMAQDGVDIIGAILTDWNADADTLRFQTGYQEAV